MKLTLKHPLVFGKTTVAELNFRDHTIAGDYLSFDQHGGVAQRIALIASLTGMDVALINKIHGYDYRKAEKIADDLISADDDEGSTGEDAAEKKPSASLPPSG